MVRRNGAAQLLDHLDEQKLAENTIVVYVADNGWIQNLDGPRYAPKSKQSPYDGGLRTPIMVRWPGHIRAAACRESWRCRSIWCRRC